MSGSIGSLFRDVLGRDPNGGEAWYVQNQLAWGRSLDSVRSEIAYSGEAAADVAWLFRNELGREAQGYDLAYWQGQLAQGTSLATLRTAFAYTPDAAAWIQNAYLRGLWRYASASEVIRDGLRTLEERQKFRAMKLEALRAEIQKGADSGPGIPAEKVFADVRARIQKIASHASK